MKKIEFPPEVVEKILCFTGDDNLFRRSLKCKYILPPLQKTITKTKKQRLLKRDLKFVFCRDFIKTVRRDKKKIQEEIIGDLEKKGDLKNKNLEEAKKLLEEIKEQETSEKCIQYRYDSVPDIEFTEWAFRALFRENRISECFQLFLLTFPTLNDKEREKFANSFFPELQQLEQYIYRRMPLSLHYLDLSTRYVQFHSKEDIMKFFIYIECMHYLTNEMLKETVKPLHNKKMTYFFLNNKFKFNNEMEFEQGNFPNSWDDFLELLEDVYEKTYTCFCRQCRYSKRKLRKFLRSSSFYIIFFLFL